MNAPKAIDRERREGVPRTLRTALCHCEESFDDAISMRSNDVRHQIIRSSWASQRRRSRRRTMLLPALWLLK
jgi:hypothetical protein